MPTLRYLFHVPTGLSVQICSGYDRLLLFIAFAIHRFVTTLFIVYIVFLIHTVGSVSSSSSGRRAWGLLALLLCLLWIRPAAAYPAALPTARRQAEDAVLGRLAAECESARRTSGGEGAAAQPRSKHSLKAQAHAAREAA